MLVGLGLSFVAGSLSTLSPCVLPLIPIVLGAAIGQHRFGPLALAAGLAISFTVIGLFVATIGFSIGLDGGFFRAVSAVLMLTFGLILVVPALQVWFATIARPAADWAEQRWGGIAGTGLFGQFAVGLLLGAVWSPCVGPTLGAASVLAAQARDIERVIVTMVLFGLGAALPLLILGVVSREALMLWRGHLAGFGAGMKAALGVTLVLTAMAIFFGIDRSIETALVNSSPEWLTDLTTRY